MNAPKSFNLRTSALEIGGNPAETLAACEALALNKIGVDRTVDVTGNVTGVRTDANTFTATSVNFVANYVVSHAAMTTPFTVGETLTETDTSATVKVVESQPTWTRVTPINATILNGAKLLTGGTSSLTATGTAKTTNVKTLAGQWCYSYDPSSPNAGVFMKVVSNTSTTIDVDGTLEATGTRLVVFANENAAYGAVDIVKADDATLGTLSGDLTLENGEKIRNDTDGMITFQASAIELEGGTGGGLMLKAAEAAVTLTGASTDIAVNVPAGCKIIGTQLRVDVLITAETGVSWGASFKTGNAQAITTGQAFLKNTKVNTFFYDEDATDVTTGTTLITISPDAGTFTAGNVRAIVYYYQFSTMPDAA